MPHHIGLIGCGNMGGVWTRVTTESPACQLDTVFDENPEAAARRAGDAGARVADSLDQIFGSPDIDTVIVATPTFTHPGLVDRAARAGKHILCEKPMALTLGQCRRMIDVCRESGVKLAIGHTIRFWGAFRTVRELVARGLIGTPCLGQVHRMGKSRVLLAHPKDDAPPPPRPWRVDTRYAGGNILESLVHELDFARSLFGDVSSVYAEITGREEYDGLLSPIVIQGLIDFKKGGQVTARMGGIVGFPCRGSWIAGTEGTLSFDAWEGPVYHHTPDADEPHTIDCDLTYAYTLELRDLLRAIERNVEPENSGTNGLKNIALGLAMYRSIETGVPLRFEGGLPTDVPDDYQYRGPNAGK